MNGTTNPKPARGRPGKGGPAPSAFLPDPFDPVEQSTSRGNAQHARLAARLAADAEGKNIDGGPPPPPPPPDYYYYSNPLDKNGTQNGKINGVGLYAPGPNHVDSSEELDHARELDRQALERRHAEHAESFDDEDVVEEESSGRGGRGEEVAVLNERAETKGRGKRNAAGPAPASAISYRSSKEKGISSKSKGTPPSKGSSFSDWGASSKGGGRDKDKWDRDRRADRDYDYGRKGGKKWDRGKGKEKGPAERAKFDPDYDRSGTATGLSGSGAAPLVTYARAADVSSSANSSVASLREDPPPNVVAPTTKGRDKGGSEDSGPPALQQPVGPPLIAPSASKGGGPDVNPLPEKGGRLDEEELERRREVERFRARSRHRAAQDPRNTYDYVRIAEREVAWVLGRRGETKFKIARASGCTMEIDEKRWTVEAWAEDPRAVKRVGGGDRVFAVVFFWDVVFIFFLKNFEKLGRHLCVMEIGRIYCIIGTICESAEMSRNVHCLRAA